MAKNSNHEYGRDYKSTCNRPRRRQRGAFPAPSKSNSLRSDSPNYPVDEETPIEEGTRLRQEQERNEPDRREPEREARNEPDRRDPGRDARPKDPAPAYQIPDLQGTYLRPFSLEWTSEGPGVSLTMVLIHGLEMRNACGHLFIKIRLITRGNPVSTVHNYSFMIEQSSHEAATRVNFDLYPSGVGQQTNNRRFKY